MKDQLGNGRKFGNYHYGRIFNDRRWIIPFLASLLVWITLFMAAVFGMYSSSFGRDPLQFDIISFARSSDSSGYFVESDLKISVDDNRSSKKEAPRFAYLISGTKGDSQRMMRTLQAVYHPRNQYILHMDLEAPPRERLDLTMSIKNDLTFQEVGNVRVMAQSNLVTYKGPTMIATTLQAIAILLRESANWDWFINLSPSDYPLVTQDDMLHVFTNISRNLNFIEHTQISGWKLNHRAKPIIVDPGLYMSKKSDLTWTSQRRSLPTTFKLFTGNPPKQHPKSLTIKDFSDMVNSSAPFARKFAKDDSALDRIDKELLQRVNRFAPGAWCIGNTTDGQDPCSLRGDDSVFRPGPGARRLQELTEKLLSEGYRSKTCKT
uniref:Uncharacterized protein n=1 Tax=Daucus carota subsp. sativus TaxID=79200 RepID=A0A166AB61_DAUCS